MSKFLLETTAARSRIMSAIRGHGNASTEKRMIRILRENGISGWRRNQKLPGSPDFTFWTERVALFVDGCFWHGCPRCYREPRQNTEFWREKMARNAARDKKVSRQLRRTGWSVLRFWEHALRDEDLVASRIKKALLRRQAELADSQQAALRVAPRERP
ncbi:MAG: hypothetical protein B7X93_09725 [Hydrogenophilales bacterium 17-61-9]|nr:MAG: hypothetical protein B7X93_09725 [Hydrogenophilales bacterium 17-61-9]